MTLRSFIRFRAFEMLVVYICAALYKISTGMPMSRCPSATAGFLVVTCIETNFTCTVVIRAKMSVFMFMLTCFKFCLYSDPKINSLVLMTVELLWSLKTLQILVRLLSLASQNNNNNTNTICITAALCALNLPSVL